ncbi:hypothetical protein [Rhodococcus daqingensis]|uniref:Uncharacterized protein n=1 Tax=Rhodococcus daqingensis TaxID=2479363 RepID=A0ABW2RXR9_9NOCA
MITNPLQEGEAMSTIAPTNDNVDFVHHVAEIPTDGGELDIEAQVCRNADTSVSRLVVVGGRGIELDQIPALIEALFAAYAIAAPGGPRTPGDAGDIVRDVSVALSARATSAHVACSYLLQQEAA